MLNAGKLRHVAPAAQYGMPPCHWTNRAPSAVFATASSVTFSPCWKRALHVGLHAIASLSRERLELTVPEPAGSTATRSCDRIRGGISSGLSGSSLNFAPTTSSPERSIVHVGVVPASWQAPDQRSNSAAGEAVSTTSANAG